MSIQTSFQNITLTREGILRILPHRGSALLIDQAEITVRDDSATGAGSHIITETDCEGHFPEKPVFPGVKIVEALAQLAGLIALQFPENKQLLDNGDMPVLVKVDGVIIRDACKPGDTLELNAEIIKFIPRHGWAVARGSAYKDNPKKLAAEVESITLAVFRKK